MGIFVYADEVSSDFVINENGVLTDYYGDGGDVVIPDGVTSIGDSAFFGCSSLTRIKGYTGSYAETYAKDKGYEFVALDEEPTPSENPTPSEEPTPSDKPIKDKAFYDVAGDDDTISLSDAQMILKYALKIAASDTQYTLADAQLCLKIALKIVSLGGESNSSGGVSDDISDSVGVVVPVPAPVPVPLVQTPTAVPSVSVGWVSKQLFKD